MRINLVFGDHYDRVYVDGGILTPTYSQQLFNHSPDGFAWGYLGSGPAQLALALLLAAGVPKERAVELHQRFKVDHVAGWPQTDHHLELDVAAWAEAQP